MTKHGIWTVIFDDKKVLKKTEEYTSADPGVYEINDDAFWSDPKWSNIHAIQFTDDNTDNDQVEHRDSTPHSEYDQATLGDFRNNFIVRWDAAHLASTQADWDANTNHTYYGPDHEQAGEIEAEETVEAKVARLGARPTSYTSA